MIATTIVTGIEIWRFWLRADEMSPCRMLGCREIGRTGTTTWRLRSQIPPCSSRSRTSQHLPRNQNQHKRDKIPVRGYTHIRREFRSGTTPGGRYSRSSSGPGS